MSVDSACGKLVPQNVVRKDIWIKGPNDVVEKKQLLVTWMIQMSHELGA